MKLGTLYDMAKQYVPGLNAALFTEFYKQALDKLSTDLNISRRTETVVASTIIPNNIVKIYSVEYDGKAISRVF